MPSSTRPPAATISVEASAAGEAVRISVQDTGPGILPEDLPHVFDPFYRGRQSSRFRQGLGLGLTIANDLVKAHGGRLEMESTPGEGSRFTIVLPCP